MSINHSKRSYQLLLLNHNAPPLIRVTVTKMHTDWNSVSPVLSDRETVMLKVVWVQWSFFSKMWSGTLERAQDLEKRGSLAA